MAEKEYIDLDAPLELRVFWGNSTKPYSSTLRELLDLNHIPYSAAEVRSVVLCRDCKMQQYCKVAQYLGKDGFCSNGEKDVRPLRKCKLYKDCEYRTIWNCCCEDCNLWE